MSIASRRKAIDGIDAALLRLVARRVRTVQMLAREKAAAGIGLRDKAREKVVLARAGKLARPPLQAKAARAVMAAVMAATRQSLQSNKGKRA